MYYIKIKKKLKKILPGFLFVFLIKIWRKITNLGKNKKNELIIQALADPYGQGKLNLLLEYGNVPEKYRYLFQYSSKLKIFVDCGSNIGKIIDIARFCNMEVFAFEPNIYAIDLLEKKFHKDNNVHLYPVAISNQNGEMNFYSDKNNLYDEGGSIIEKGAEYLDTKYQYKVKCIRLIDFLERDIFSKYEDIYILKLDIEGAEFDVLEDIIQNKTYKKIKYIICETHERFFGKKLGKQKLDRIKTIISEHNIKNIYLDWI